MVTCKFLSPHTDIASSRHLRVSYAFSGVTQNRWSVKDAPGICLIRGAQIDPSPGSRRSVFCQLVGARGARRLLLAYLDVHLQARGMPLAVSAYVSGYQFIEFFKTVSERASCYAAKAGTHNEFEVFFLSFCLFLFSFLFYSLTKLPLFK